MLIRQEGDGGGAVAGARWLDGWRVSASQLHSIIFYLAGIVGVQCSVFRVLGLVFGLGISLLSFGYYVSLSCIWRTFRFQSFSLSLFLPRRFDSIGFVCGASIKPGQAKVFAKRDSDSDWLSIWFQFAKSSGYLSQWLTQSESLNKVCKKNEYKSVVCLMVCFFPKATDFN